MKRLYLALTLAATPLAGCATIPTSPAQVANHTVADEQARLRCEQGYSLSLALGRLGVSSGLIHGARATQAAALDNRLYSALQTCRAAYTAFNSASILSAADNIKSLADQVQALVSGGNQ